LVALAAVAAGATHLAAQGGPGTVAGVLRRGSLTGPPVAGRWVVLHQVNAASGGPIDSTRTDAAGRWRLRTAHVDTLAIYVASALHDGLAYFSAPLPVVAGSTTTALPLVVYDTSSTGPRVSVRRRFVTIARPKPDGSREVLEILELDNPGRATRIAPDTLQPTWAGAIPPAALDFEVQQSDFSADAVLRRGGDVQLFGPVQPDRTHQLSYRYVLSGATHRRAGRPARGHPRHGRRAAAARRRHGDGRRAPLRDLPGRLPRLRRRRLDHVPRRAVSRGEPAAVPDRRGGPGARGGIVGGAAASSARGGRRSASRRLIADALRPAAPRRSLHAHRERGTRKPVKVRHGPATVTGMLFRAGRHWETGKAPAGSPEVRRPRRSRHLLSLAGGMVALATH
jgi:hypothetical protein